MRGSAGTTSRSPAPVASPRRTAPATRWRIGADRHASFRACRRGRASFARATQERASILDYGEGSPCAGRRASDVGHERALSPVGGEAHPHRRPFTNVQAASAAPPRGPEALPGLTSAPTGRVDHLIMPFHSAISAMRFAPRSPTRSRSSTVLLARARHRRSPNLIASLIAQSKTIGVGCQPGG